MDKFVDLFAAGKELSVALGEFTRQEKTCVVGIAAGGVPVAVEVAKALDLPFEVLLLKRLQASQGPESVLCAFDLAGRLLLDDELGLIPNPPTSGPEYALMDGLAELERRKRVCRGSHPEADLAGYTVLLIDNGIRTGSTILAAVRVLRKAKVDKIVAAVPVANPDRRKLVEDRVDQLMCLYWPENFGHVGMWYKDFTRPSDDLIRELLTSNQIPSTASFQTMETGA
jgi:putative phosphoribosyl transferase